LHEADLSATLVADLLDSLNADGSDPSEFEAALRRSLLDRVRKLTCSGLDLQPGDRLVVVGPAGAGKSSVIGKLAAEEVALRKRKVTLRTIDSAKLGAHDEALGLAMVTGAAFADTGGDSPTPFSPNHVNLIDTSALPLAASRFGVLAEKIQSLHPTHCLAVFAAPMRTSEIDRYAVAMRTIGVTHIALAKLDLTPSWGGGLVAAATTGCPLALVTDAYAGFGSMAPPDPEAIADHLLRAEAEDE
jgi:flagellar biosynthesis protein FlhF